MTAGEWLTILHGLVLGAVLLLGFTGATVGLWTLDDRLLTADGVRRGVRRTHAMLWALAVTAWATVLLGTFVVYPRYRAPGGARSVLLSQPDLAAWHTVGMEWKEHAAWLVPILLTAVATLVGRVGPELAARPTLRRALLGLLLVAFITALGVGLAGAMLNKIAPVR